MRTEGKKKGKCHELSKMRRTRPSKAYRPALESAGRHLPLRDMQQPVYRARARPRFWGRATRQGRRVMLVRRGFSQLRCVATWPFRSNEAFFLSDDALAAWQRFALDARG